MRLAREGEHEKLLLFSALLWGVVGVLAGSAFSAAGGTNLPLKGSFSGTSELGGNDDQLHVSTAGLISHLGRTTVEQSGFAPYCSPLGCPDFSFPQRIPFVRATR